MDQETREAIAMFRYGLICELIHSKQHRGVIKQRMYLHRQEAL